MRRRPFPVVIAAPSGAGKTSLARALVERDRDAIFSVSATTRPPRADEQAGRDYRFVDESEFDRMIAGGELAEWAIVHGCRYGTPRAEIEKALDRGRIVVLDIDVQGARQIRDAFPDALLVFILPPSAAELLRRLTGRRSERPADQRRRLATARRELAAAPEFDYVVVNDDFEVAAAALCSIVDAERLRVSRTDSLDAELRRLDREIGAMIENVTGVEP